MGKDAKGHGSNPHAERFAGMSNVQLDKHFAKATKERGERTPERKMEVHALLSERAKRRDEPYKVFPSKGEMKGMAKTGPSKAINSRGDTFKPKKGF